VRKIFEWSAAGLGAFGILDRLNGEGIPGIGRTGKWERSYVRKILTSRAVLGEYQPHTGSRAPHRKPQGDPVLNFYPQIIDQQLWDAATGAAKARERKSGRPASAAFNPFSGLLRDATDGEKLHVMGTHGPKYRYFVSHAAIMKRPGSKWRAFPVDALVRALLSMLKELGAADLFSDPGAGKLAALNGKLAEVEKRLAVAVEKFDADPESPTWADRVSKYDKEKRALVLEIREASIEASNPLSGSWAEAVALMAEEEPERLRAALLATVEGVWCVIVRKGYNHLCAAQVHFKGGSVRDYLVLYRQGQGRRRGLPARPARVNVVSLASVTDAEALDLRKQSHARRLEKVLATMELSTEMAGGNGDR
jgi:hypothetical protein